MKKRVLLIDTNHAHPKTIESIRIISNLTHKLWLKKISQNKLLKKLNKDRMLKMFSSSEQWPITTGLLNISSYLKEMLEKENNFVIEYIHMSYYLKRYKKKAFEKISKKLKDTILVGLTCTTPNFYNAIEIANFIKKINPKITIAIGGPHVSFTDTETIKEKSIDIVVRGEGEKIFLNIIKSVDKKDFSKVKGITYKKNNQTIRNPDEKQLFPNEIMNPDYSWITKDYSDKFIISLSASRGCPFNCYFCSETNFWKHNIRHKPLERVIEEIKTIKKTFKNVMIHISDSNFAVSKKQISEFISILKKEKLNTMFSVNMRADIINKLSISDIEEMVKNGFVEFMIGVESGSEKMLKLMNKKEKFKDITNALSKLKKAGVPIVRTYWMLGFPGENKKTLKESYDGLKIIIKKKLSDYAIIKLYFPYPGTPVFEQPKKFGLKILTKDWNQYERFSFPPPYKSETIDEFELLSQLIIMNAYQMRSFASDLNINDETLNRMIFEEVKN